MSPSSIVQNGPDRIRVRSTTRMPSSGCRAAGPQATGEVEGTCRRTGDAHLVELGARYEGTDAVVVTERAAHLTEQVDRGIPAAADQQHITRQRRGFAVGTGDHCGADPGFTLGAADDRAGSKFDAAVIEMAKELADYWLGRFVEMRNEFASLQIRHSELAEHHNKHCQCGQLR